MKKNHINVLNTVMNKNNILMKMLINIIVWLKLKNNLNKKRKCKKKMMISHNKKSKNTNNKKMKYVILES